jgi:hypothetical protein
MHEFSIVSVLMRLTFTVLYQIFIHILIFYRFIFEFSTCTGSNYFKTCLPLDKLVKFLYQHFPHIFIIIYSTFFLVVCENRRILHIECPRRRATKASLFITKLGTKSSCVWVWGEGVKWGGCFGFVERGNICCLLALHFPAFRSNILDSVVSKHKFQPHMSKTHCSFFNSFYVI